MKKRWIALTALVFFTFGAASASWFWLDLNAKVMNGASLIKIESDISAKAAILERIRAGRIDEATNLVEIMLDGDFISAAALAQEGKRLSASTDLAILKEMKARANAGDVSADEDSCAAVQEAIRTLQPSLMGADQPAMPQGACR